MNKNKILVYGFGPYAHYRHNVTADIIKAIAVQKITSTYIFQTKFSRTMFDCVLDEYQPELIIGLGQDSRARKIRIERKAKNWRKGLLTLGRPISKAGPEHHYVSLKVVSNADSTITYDAGAYVCNYSMYVMCEYCKKTDAKFAFLHVPVKVDVSQVACFVTNIIKGFAHAD